MNNMPQGKYIKTEEHKEKLREHLKMVSLKRIGHGKDKQWNKVCSWCKKEYKSFHNRGKFCSSSCIDKDRYHNKPNRKALVKAKQIKIYTAIGQCELCEVSYQEIKTMKDLGSTMYNGASVFYKDHIIPQSKGGDDSEENTRFLCWFCNMARKDMDSKYDEAIRKSAIAFWEELKNLYS